MIAKKVSMRAQKKSSMTDLVSYLTEEHVQEGPEELVRYMTDEQGNPVRVGHVRITHCQASEPAWAAAEMRAVQRMNKRAVSDKTYHMIISFPPGETPNLRTLHTIEDRFCRELGFAEHQRISVVHRDTEHLHIHIAINKIHPKTYRLHEPYYDHRTRSRVCAQLEAEFNLTRGNHQSQQSEAQAQASDMTAHSGVDSLIAWIKQHCQTELEQAESWAALRQVLRENDLDLRQRANGFVFVARDGTRCKASSVSRRLSMPALLARLGPMPAVETVLEPAEFLPGAPAASTRETENATPRETQNAATIETPNSPPRRSYRRTVSGLNPPTAALFARYQTEQARLRALKAEQRAAARKRKDRRVAAAKRRARLERATVKLVSQGLSAKLAYMAIRTRLRAELSRASEEFAKERKLIQARYPLQSWRDWLKSQERERGAAVAVRSREAQPSRSLERVRAAESERSRDAELSR